MENAESNILKTKLDYSVERLTDIINDLPEKLNEIKSVDSLGEDEKDLFKIIEDIRTRFLQYSKDLDSPFKIAVVGSQGTGKSTLVNLLLGESLMPSTTMENESAVIRLAYPTDDELVNQAVFKLKNEEIKKTTIDEAIIIIDKATRESKDDVFVKDIEYVTFYLENERLKEIELINTPGMNVLTDDFYPKVQHLFSEADIILWVNSSEQILDKFNSWLIEKIHADNDKIVGIITFPDKLYRQDENVGVTDVVSQFMRSLENKRLVRFQDKVGLFIINGKFAQIAYSQKEDFKFINDLDEVDEEEEKLRMIYNFLHHNFAYSDDEENIEILRGYNLYGIENDGIPEFNQKFELESFYKFCVEKELCKIDKDSNSAKYTEKGRKLIGEVSQYNSFGRFTEAYLIPLSKKSKYAGVSGRLNRMLSEKESSNNSKSRLLQIQEQLKNEKGIIQSDEDKRREEFENIIKIMKNEYSDWRKREVEFQTDKFLDELVVLISNRIDDEINWMDFSKEVGSSLIPNWLKVNEDTAISKKMFQIVEESIESVLPKSIKSITEDSNKQIEYIMIKMQKDYLSQKEVKSNNTRRNSSSPSTGINTNNLVLEIGKHLKPLLQKISMEIIEKIARRDLRKGANTFMKKNIIKPVVKLIRRLFHKQIKKAAAKKAAQGSKSLLGPVAIGLIAYDFYSLGNDMKKMYVDMKESLKESLKNDPSFRKMFDEEANRVYTGVVDEVEKELNYNFMKVKKDEAYIVEGIRGCQNVILELNKIENKN